MWRLIYFIPVWFGVFLVSTPFYILGFILIPLACLFKAYEKASDNLDKPNDGATYHFTWFFMWPWDNYTTDGIACRNYYTSPFKPYSYFDMLFTVFVWSAYRNPINNLERLISPRYNFNKLQWIGSKLAMYKADYHCWYLIWQGPFAGYYKSFTIFGKLYYIKIGYKFRTYKDAASIPESQVDGVGFTFRIIPKAIKN